MRIELAVTGDISGKICINLNLAVRGIEYHLFIIGIRAVRAKKGIEAAVTHINGIIHRLSFSDL